MRLLALSIVATVAAVTGVGQTHNTLSKAERASGWRLLFDGSTFAGWADPLRKVPPGDSWVIEDGCLKALPGRHILEDLKTTAAFADFELKFDWRVQPGGNSGVKYRIWGSAFLIYPNERRESESVIVSDRSKMRPDQYGSEYEVAMEFQLIDDVGHPDALKGPDRQTGSLYAFAPRTKLTSKPAGQWNESRLVVRGLQVEHWVNGEQVLRASLDDPKVVEKVEARWGRFPELVKAFHEKVGKPSVIALQNHGDSVVWFRNLKVRTISDERVQRGR